MTLAQDDRDNWQLEGLTRKILRVGLIVGIGGFLASGTLGFFGAVGPGRILQSYLVSFCFYLSLALGALFFVLLQHLTGSTWSVVVRRLAEAIASNLWVMAVLAIPILLGLSRLYAWADPATMQADSLLQEKARYLNPAFFIVRTVIYFAVWIGLAEYYRRRSFRQDETQDLSLTLRMEDRSAPATVLFGVTLTFAAFDYLMSLQPHWFSTIFGVYFFSGCMFGFFALLPLLVHLLQRTGRLRLAVSPEHYHDLGKWMFAFVIFWAYIGFSQYLLIWYGNIPEETVWFYARQQGGWVAISLILLFGHFLLPFFGLLPRTVKKVSSILVVWSVWMLAVHWFDLYWIVMPNFHPGAVPLHPIDVSVFLGLGGIFFAAAAFGLRGRSLVPAGDPRLQDSLGFENA
jgi:hypothetical protein